MAFPTACCDPLSLSCVVKLCNIAFLIQLLRNSVGPSAWARILPKLATYMHKCMCSGKAATHILLAYLGSRRVWSVLPGVACAHSLDTMSPLEAEHHHIANRQQNSYVSLQQSGSVTRKQVLVWWHRSVLVPLISFMSALHACQSLLMGRIHSPRQPHYGFIIPDWQAVSVVMWSTEKHLSQDHNQLQENNWHV